MKIVICDDNMQVCFGLEKIILEYSAMKEYKIQIEVLNSGSQLKAYLDMGEQIDLLYLDIEMPGLNGVEIGHYIRERLSNLQMYIVYISSYEKYAMELFAVSPLHFLVKPLDESKVYLTLDRIVQLLSQSRQTFSYQIKHTIKRVPIGEIFYFKSYGREVEIQMIRGVERFYASLDSIYLQLREHRFIYCHQSYLINYNKARLISSKEIEMENGCCIPVSQGKWPSVKALRIQFGKEDL